MQQSFIKYKQNEFSAIVEFRSLFYESDISLTLLFHSFVFRISSKERQKGG